MAVRLVSSVKLLIVSSVVLLAFAACPSASADLPVNYTMTGDHFALWVDWAYTTNHPTNLMVDRSGGTHNVLSWHAPIYSDGRTLVGYTVHRVPSTAPIDPVFDAYLAGATTLSYTDTGAAFDSGNAYFVTAVFEDSFGVATASVPGNIVVVHPALDQPGYPYCNAVSTNLAVFPYVLVQSECLLPPPV